MKVNNTLFKIASRENKLKFIGCTLYLTFFSVAEPLEIDDKFFRKVQAGSVNNLL